MRSNTLILSEAIKYQGTRESNFTNVTDMNVKLTLLIRLLLTLLSELTSAVLYAKN